jgi:hypothetical protein
VESIITPDLVTSTPPESHNNKLCLFYRKANNYISSSTNGGLLIYEKQDSKGKSLYSIDAKGYEELIYSAEIADNTLILDYQLSPDGKWIGILQKIDNLYKLSLINIKENSKTIEYDLNYDLVTFTWFIDNSIAVSSMINHEGVVRPYYYQPILYIMPDNAILKQIEPINNFSRAITYFKIEGDPYFLYSGEGNKSIFLLNLIDGKVHKVLEWITNSKVIDLSDSYEVSNYLYFLPTEDEKHLELFIRDGNDLLYAQISLSDFTLDERPEQIKSIYIIPDNYYGLFIIKGLYSTHVYINTYDIVYRSNSVLFSFDTLSGMNEYICLREENVDLSIVSPDGNLVSWVNNYDQTGEMVIDSVILNVKRKVYSYAPKIKIIGWSVAN